MEGYLQANHTDDITSLLNENDENAHLSIFVSLQHLQQANFGLFHRILKATHAECQKWDKVLLEMQKKIVEHGDAFLDDNYTIKVNCHVRFINLPPPDPRYKPRFPGNDQIGQFVQLKANVVRITQPKLFERKREYACSKCKETILVEAKYERMYVFEPPRCSDGTCKGTMYQAHSKPLPQFCLDFQEIRIQELLNERNIPASLTVTLENDLVDSCQPGECITLCGTIERRWKQIVFGKRPDIIIAMRAISLTRDKKRLLLSDKFQPEHLICLKAEWEASVAQLGELEVRDTIVESICPEIHGMYPVKLAIALVVCSGGIENTTTTSSGTSVRGQSHLLLVGDPGLAKSRLLMSAAAFAPRAVHTTGMGSSAAGLTAAAIQENGEWQLEAGALVLGDGGICCIDEFNLMREIDRASIHEAMEQQTVSLAKAGMVCKLSTRTAVLAATNPRNLYTMSDPQGTSSMNIGIASPLMSRFDLVYILRDERDEKWDDLIATHLLEQAKGTDVSRMTTRTLWNVDRLQSHFAAIRTVHPRLTNEANRLLGEYYRICRNDPQRDHARTTVRLLDSLTRLAQAHARLLFRHEVTAYDAVMVIRLMESTHGFGRILKPFDVIKEKFPLGPSQEDVEEVYPALNLGEFIHETAEMPTQIPDSIRPPVSQAQVSSQNATSAIAETPRSQCARRPAEVSVADEDSSDSELDKILTLDNFGPFSHTSTNASRDATQMSVNGRTQNQTQSAAANQRNNEDGDEAFETEDFDEILSLALDEAQQSTQRTDVRSSAIIPEVSAGAKPIPTVPTAAPKVSKFTTFRSKMRLTLNHTKDVGNPRNVAVNVSEGAAPQNANILSNLNETAQAATSHAAGTSVNYPVKKRNRLLVDSSDSSDDEPVHAKRSPFRNPPAATVSTSKVSSTTICNLNVQAEVASPSTKKDKTPSQDEDSAYISQLINEHYQAGHTSSDQSGCITSSSQFQIKPTVLLDDDDDEDLTCLDSLDL